MCYVLYAEWAGVGRYQTRTMFFFFFLGNIPVKGRLKIITFWQVQKLQPDLTLTVRRNTARIGAA